MIHTVALYKKAGLKLNLEKMVWHKQQAWHSKKPGMIAVQNATIWCMACRVAGTWCWAKNSF